MGTESTSFNSRWIADEEAINSVHPQHVGGWFDRLNHYFFVFHDEMFAPWRARYPSRRYGARCRSS